jgi:hypothetical protein
VDRRVPYSQTSWFEGYRQDCSGFVSMAWVLRASYPTGMMDLIARPIPKWALRSGDVLLNNSATYPHVVLFGWWTDRSHTSYVGFEQIGSAGRPVRRVLPYPYRVHASRYTPYRFTGIPPGMAGNPRKPAAPSPRPATEPAPMLPAPPAATLEASAPPGPLPADLPLAAATLLVPATLIGLVWRFRDVLGW